MVRVRPIVLAAALALLVGCGGGQDAVRKTTAPSKPAHAALRVDLGADPAQIAARAHVPILCYHQIRDRTAADAAVDRPYIVPVARFKAQMRALASRGFHAITPARLLAYLTTGQRLPSRPVMLTFDDADDDQYTVALPVLRRLHFKATFFVMTVVLGNPGYMTKAQVRRLDAAGMTIGGHTWDHHRVDQYAGDDWRVQIDEPTRELQRIVGHPIRYFAYPYGAWSPAAFAHLRRAGYLAAFQLSDRPVDRSQPLLTVPRRIAAPDVSTTEFLRGLRPS